MASEIRVNKINSRTGVGTITLSPTGVDFTGIATVATLKATTGIVTTFSVTGNATVGGTLGVTGTSTLSGNATVGGTLNVTGETTFATHVNLGDSDKLKFGAGDDLQIYHDGSKSLITDSGTGHLEVDTNDFRVQNAAANETILTGTENGSVDLYYDNSRKFRTTGVGASVIGTFNVGTGTSITSSSLKVNDVQYPDSGPLSNRNFVINGAMTVAQRSTSAVTNVNFFSSNIKYDAIDRWGYWASQASKFTVQQVADAPAGFYNSLKITSLAATTHGAGDGYTISQRIEAQNLHSASLGTADAKNLVVSFWVKSSLTGTFAFYMMSGNLTSSFVQNYTINAANTWEYKTISIPGPTSGTYNVGTNNYGVEFGFSLGTGGSWDTATLGSWENVTYQINSTTATNVLGTNGATFQITGVQIELGDKATPFEHRSYGDDLAKCQRYFYRHATSTSGASRGIGIASLYAADQAYGSVFLPVTMRAAPTVVSTDIADSFQLYSHGSGKTFDKFLLQESNHTSPTIYANLNSNGTQGDAAWWRVPDGSTASLSFEAEL